MKKKPLDRNQLLEIRKTWLHMWNKKSIPSMEAAWYEVIVDFLQYEGVQLVPDDLRLTEMILIEKGLEKEYFACLMELVNPPHDFTEEAKFLMVMNATTQEREKALKFVLVN